MMTFLYYCFLVRHRARGLPQASSSDGWLKTNKKKKETKDTNNMSQATTLSESELKYCATNIDLCCNIDCCYDVVIVCTGNPSQEKYWQSRLESGLGVFFPKTTVVLAVHEDWEGGAGNGLGTLYAYKKACAAATLRDIDLPQLLRDGASVALYHTAGKGTRLAPLPGSEKQQQAGSTITGTSYSIERRES